MSHMYALCGSGISGNMMVGALLDYGVPFSYLEEQIGRLHLAGYDLIMEPCVKQGVEGVYFDVNLHLPKRGFVGNLWRCMTHGIDYFIGHSHHYHGDRRNYPEIKQIIEKSGLSDWVIAQSVAAFTYLGTAEAAVHKSTLEKVHFHEVGAVDCMIDIVGTMICLDYLEITEITFSPLHVGQGKVYCDHGLMDIPTPATKQLLSGMETFVTDVHGELVTPTGAALVKTLQSADKNQISMDTMETILAGAQRIGVGAGLKDLPIPNVLRLGTIEE